MIACYIPDNPDPEKFKEIKIGNEIGKPPINLVKNSDYYPKSKSCTEKSACCLCPYWKDCNVEDAIFSDEDLKIINIRGKKMLEELAEKNGYITKDELIKIAKTYGINTEPGRFNKLLADYKEIGLIEPSIMKSKASLGILGERGTVGFYKKNTPEIIYITKLSLKEGFSLPEISEYHQMVVQKVMSHIAAYGLNCGLCDSNTEKYYRIMVYFLAIEAKIDFTKHNLSKMNFKFEYIYSGPDHYYTDPPLYMKIIYIDGGEIIGEATY